MNSYGTKCPKCGSENFIDTNSFEYCEDCGYEARYEGAREPWDYDRKDEDNKENK